MSLWWAVVAALKLSRSAVVLEFLQVLHLFLHCARLTFFKDL